MFNLGISSCLKLFVEELLITSVLLEILLGLIVAAEEVDSGEVALLQVS
jgi:hypothetical protein